MPVRHTGWESNDRSDSAERDKSLRYRELRPWRREGKRAAHVRRSDTRRASSLCSRSWSLCPIVGHIAVPAQLLELPVQRVPGDAEQLRRATLVALRLPQRLLDGPELQLVETERPGSWRAG